VGVSDAAALESDAEQGIARIRCGNRLIAIIVFGEFRARGIHFFTPSEFSQQLAYMRHPQGKIIAPHIHRLATRQVHYTQETLFIKKGKVRVDFYDNDQTYLESRVLQAGDVILLIECGHGFEALEELEMIEVKQGPYIGEQDKIRFDAALPKVLYFGSSGKR
jgi:mannose-6-phosphate isomerase-like protein (cupin superfamily)